MLLAPLERTSRLTKPTTLTEAFEQVCVMDAPLNERLVAYSTRLQELNFPFAEAYDVLTERLIEGEIGTQAPKVGEPMPPFLIPGPGKRLVTLDELLKDGPLVLSFNRGHWCPFCRIELRAIAELHEEIARSGARVVSILPEGQKFASRLDAETGRRLLILSDIDNAYALNLGLVLWLGDRLHQLMAGRGLHLEKYQGNDGWFVPLPATFVIDQDGRVAARHVDADFRKRMDSREILAVLARLRRGHSKPGA